MRLNVFGSARLDARIALVCADFHEVRAPGVMSLRWLTVPLFKANLEQLRPSGGVLALP